MKYDVLLFDLDDTLFDFSETEKHALNNTFHAYGMPNGIMDYRASYKKISSGLWNDLEKGLVTLTDLKIERFKKLFLQYKLTLNPEDFSQTYIENLGKQAHIIDGAEEMLENLSSYRLVILTNGFQDVQHARIALSSLKHTFEAVITSEESGYQKPQSEFFEYAFKKLNLYNKHNVLMIGDSLTSDIQGGYNFGIDTCWFNPHKKENTTTINPTFEVSNYNELEQIVNRVQKE